MAYYEAKIVLLIFLLVFIIKIFFELYKYKFHYKNNTLANVLEVEEIYDSSYYNFRATIEYITENGQKINNTLLVSIDNISVGDKLNILYNIKNINDIIQFKGKYKDYQKEKLLIVLFLLALSLISYFFMCNS